MQNPYSASSTPLLLPVQRVIDRTYLLNSMGTAIDNRQWDSNFENALKSAVLQFGNQYGIDPLVRQWWDVRPFINNINMYPNTAYRWVVKFPR